LKDNQVYKSNDLLEDSCNSHSCRRC